MARAPDLAGAALPPGAKFGRYTIVRPIGAGGMGAVYEATQESPRRSVALKVIRGSWLSAQMLRRFEHESQVLGRLQHPGIAQVYEAGSVTGDGGEGGGVTPFFAMELIKGVPLTEYAAGKGLGTRERLELVARICDAVYHAHQKGVIHRDLKPGNILVDESGQPKILDFGVARATDSDIQQTTMQTDIGQLIGTVPYMSPEQVSGDPNDLDTRSDVYALGVIAYELLAGRLPYDLQKKMIHEVVRVIREEDPTRLSSINRTLRGDIETIVAKALEKDKQRRYQSAEALGSDIRRYLKDEPITARPASTWYQAGKFARRNKVLVGGVAATFLVLVTGIIGVSLMLQRALEAEHDLGVQVGETTAALTKAQEAEAETAKRAGELQQVSDFQEKMLGQVDPTTAGVWLTEDVTKKLAAALEKAGVTEEERTAQIDAFRQQWVKVNATDAARELIDRTILRPAVKAIDEQFKDQPLVDAQLRQVLANRYRELGLYEAAMPLQTRALDTHRHALGGDHNVTLSSMNSMGILLKETGDFSHSETHLRETLETRRRVLGVEHKDTLTSMNSLAYLLQARGDLVNAEPLYAKALEARRRVLGEEHPKTLQSINNMGMLLHEKQQLAEAELFLSEAMEKGRRVLGESHPETINFIHNYGFLLLAQLRLAESEKYFHEVLMKCRDTLGEEHPSTVNALLCLGSVLELQGRLEEAKQFTSEAMLSSRRALGSSHPHSVTAEWQLGSILHSLGDLHTAETLYRHALGIARKLYGDRHGRTLNLVNSMSTVLMGQNRFAEAEPFALEYLETNQSVAGEEHAHTIIAKINLGTVRHGQKRYREAEQLFRDALTIGRRVRGEHHPSMLVCATKLAAVLNDQHKHAEAMAVIAPLEDVIRIRFSASDPPRIATFLCAIAVARVGIGYDAERFALAEANLLEAHPIFVQSRGEAHKETLDCVQGLVDLYTAWHAAEPDKGHDAKAAEWKAKLPAAEPPPVAPPSTPPG